MSDTWKEDIGGVGASLKPRTQLSDCRVQNQNQDLGSGLNLMIFPRLAADMPAVVEAASCLSLAQGKLALGPEVGKNSRAGQAESTLVVVIFFVSPEACPADRRCWSSGTSIFSSAPKKWDLLVQSALLDTVGILRSQQFFFAVQIQLIVETNTSSSWLYVSDRPELMASVMSNLPLQRAFGLP